MTPEEHAAKIKKRDYVYLRSSTNVVKLINQVKSNKKKEKINTILITAAATLTLVISGIIISL